MYILVFIYVLDTFVNSFAEYIIHGAVPWNVNYVWCSLNTLRTEKMAGILRKTFKKNAVFSETSSFHISLTEQLLDFIVLNFGNKWISDFLHSFLWNKFNYSSSSTLHIFLHFNECWCYIAKAIIVHNVNIICIYSMMHEAILLDLWLNAGLW